MYGGGSGSEGVLMCGGWHSEGSAYVLGMAQQGECSCVPDCCRGMFFF